MHASEMDTNRSAEPNKHFYFRLVVNYHMLDVKNCIDELDESNLGVVLFIP